MELRTWQAGNPDSGPRVLITGGMHGDEFESMAALSRLSDLLGERVVRGQVTLVPVVNEAAFRLGQRVADDGLDLARICPGRADGSITERVAHSLSRLIGACDYYLDLHSGGTRLRVYPLAGYMLHPDAAVLDQQRRMARAFGLPIIWGTDPSLNGRSLSVARDARVPAIYAEYLGSGVCDPQGVAAYVRGCLNVLVDLRVIAGEIVPPDLEPLVIEDPRKDSGFLQIQHPSPLEGFFQPAVTLGHRVRPGDVLGSVSDPLGPAVVPIRSDRSGFVLVLRAWARVSAGESVAVVMETERMPPPWSSRPLLTTREPEPDGVS